MSEGKVYGLEVGDDNGEYPPQPSQRWLPGMRCLSLKTTPTIFRLISEKVDG